MNIFIIVIGLLLPVLMIVIGLLWSKHPPKKINAFYGYRTQRSTQNQQTWDFAHRTFADISIWAGPRNAYNLCNTSVCITYIDRPRYSYHLAASIPVGCHPALHCPGTVRT